MKPLTRYAPALEGGGPYAADYATMLEDERGSYYAKDEADARIAELEAECDAARADAERNRVNAGRYEWLRSRVPGGTYRIMGVIYSEGGEGVDAAIDAARGAE